MAHPPLSPPEPRLALTLRTRGQVSVLAAADPAAPSPFALVVRHYWHQLPRRYLHLRLGPFVLAPCALLGTLERLPLVATAPDPPRASVAEAVRWFVVRTERAYRRGVAIRGWPPLAGRVWATPCLAPLGVAALGAAGRASRPT